LATLKTGYHHGDLRTALIDAGLALTRQNVPILEGVTTEGVLRGVVTVDQVRRALQSAFSRSLA